MCPFRLEHSQLGGPEGPIKIKHPTWTCFDRLNFMGKAWGGN